MTDLELKQKRWEIIVGSGALLLALVILGPLFITILHGIGVLAALGFTGLSIFVVSKFIPAFAELVATWRLKALKAVAAANPIEQFEKEYEAAMIALKAKANSIIQTNVALREIWGQIQEHDRAHPDTPSGQMENYQKLRQLLVFQNDQYTHAKGNLAAYADWLDERRSEWKIAQSVAKAMKLADATASFQVKLQHDAAVDAIRTGINTAFAQIDSSLMEAQGNQPTISTTSAAAPIAKAQSTKALNAPPDLNLDLSNDNTVDAEVIPARRGRK